MHVKTGCTAPGYRRADVPRSLVSASSEAVRVLLGEEEACCRSLFGIFGRNIS
jgi:hypothetical protein